MDKIRSIDGREGKEKERMKENLYSVEVSVCALSPQIAAILTFFFLQWFS
jgi:hypothetical protein